jgi:hypothetical protein
MKKALLVVIVVGASALALTGVLLVQALYALTPAAPAAPPPVQLSNRACTDGLVALGWQRNGLASPEQEQQSARQFFPFITHLLDEQIASANKNAAAAGNMGGFGALPGYMRQQINLLADTERACGVPVVPPPSLAGPRDTVASTRARLRSSVQAAACRSTARSSRTRARFRRRRLAAI